VECLLMLQQHWVAERQLHQQHQHLGPLQQVLATAEAGHLRGGDRIHGQQQQVSF
jgi:hypothetical protein